ncbi:hypothetical protein DPMN_112788 [Dreissena polymorpha]|uniref:Uncharacterized protein n=1 Tax=Dreissena polymorpha TaxID=45954 RepID=A0A9D4KH62_DREPO|nr:hypothetical protein DPMN_112788 [Dreissena polymorpha]
MPSKKDCLAKKKPSKFTKNKVMVPADNEALQASQAYVIVHVQTEAHAAPSDAACPDPGPQADTDYVALGEAEAVVDGM